MHDVILILCKSTAAHFLAREQMQLQKIQLLINSYVQYLS